MRGWKVALIALMATVATQAQAQADKQATTNEPPPIAGGAVLGVEVRELALIATGYRVSKLIGETVYNDKNERIGKVDDFIVRPEGALSYAIVEVGGFLGMKEHRVAIPINQFSAMKPRLTLPGATKPSLKAMPEFKYAPGQ